MKRFKSLALVLLALSLALALCACGDKPEEADTDAPEQNVTEPQDPGSEPAEDPGEQTQGADLEARTTSTVTMWTWMLPASRQCMPSTPIR